MNSATPHFEQLKYVSSENRFQCLKVAKALFVKANFLMMMRRIFRLASGVNPPVIRERRADI